jgi:hypothetical protein
LEGVSVITDAQDKAVTVSAGDRLVIPRGFVGTWEVVEATRKIYVSYETGEYAAPWSDAARVPVQG